MLLDSKLEWDKGLMRDLDMSPSNIRGLSKVHIAKKIRFQVINDGTRPAFDIKFKYEICTYKNQIEFGIDEADVKSVKAVPHKSSSREENIDYLAPKEFVELDVVFASNYPTIEIFVTQLKSNEVKSIKKRTRVFVYKNSDYIDLGDSDDYRKMIGV